MKTVFQDSLLIFEIKEYIFFYNIIHQYSSCAVASSPAGPAAAHGGELSASLQIQQPPRLKRGVYEGLLLNVFLLFCCLLNIQCVFLRKLNSFKVKFQGNAGKLYSKDILVYILVYFNGILSIFNRILLLTLLCCQIGIAKNHTFVFVFFYNKKKIIIVWNQQKNQYFWGNVFKFSIYS